MVELNLKIAVAMFALLPFCSFSDDVYVDKKNNIVVLDGKNYSAEQQEELYRLEMERLIQQEVESELKATPCYFYPYCGQFYEEENYN